MNWSEMFNNENTPNFEQIESFIGENVYLWRELLLYIEKTYQIKPKMSCSKCSAQPGWNVKYNKSGKSLCTLYPMEGYFIALVVVGAKEENEMELALNAFTSYTADLYRRTSFSCGGRWLMIEVKNEDTLEDVKKLINIRVKPKKINNV